MRFSVTNSAGSNLGLAEIEVWQSGASKPAATADEESFPANVDAPKHFSLSPIYPNPFNAEAVSQLHLPGNGHVLAVIYDLMGKEIKRVYNGTMPAGQRSLRWEGKNGIGEVVGAGVYLLRKELHFEMFNAKIKNL